MSKTTSNNNNTKIINFLKQLVSPMAVGVYFTMIMLTLAFAYYSFASEGQRVNAVLEFIQDMHAATIDYRLKFRGERKGSERVAVLAVDEKAVTAIGRWPWPRDVIAKAVENAVQLGAKVIATDIIFSEKSDRPEIKVIEKLKESNLVNNSRPELIEQTLADFDADEKFSQTIERINDHIILGNMFLYENRYRGRIIIPGHSLFCQDLVFQKTNAAKAFLDGEARVAAIDQDGFHFSQILQEAYDGFIEEQKNSINAKHPSVRTLNQQYLIDAEIERELENYCLFDFLNADSDPMYSTLAENWSAVLEADKTLDSTSFDEWLHKFKGASLNNAITDASGWIVNEEKIRAKAKYNGYFNAFLDEDGVIRSTKLVVRSGTNYFPSIAFLAFLIDQNLNAELRIKQLPADKVYKGISSITLNNADSGDPVGEIPVSPDGGIYIDFAGPKHMYAHVSLADILDETTDEMEITQKIYNPATKHFEEPTGEKIKVKKTEFMKDKIFVLGATAIGIFDLRNTPFDGNYPGAETHANVISNLLEKKFLSRAHNENNYMYIFLAVLGLLMSFILAHSGALIGLAVTATSFFSIGYLDMEFLFKQGYLSTLIFPLLLLGGLYVILTFYKYFTEERAKRELRSTFNKYVSPAIVEEVLRDPKNLELGGRKERITVFFSDVRGFTTISEKLDPRALSDLLNSYLTPMTELVFKNKGTLDKYMGDAVMAFFGAPIHYEDHAKHACLCALQSVEKLHELNKIYEKKKLPAIDIGIGLNTGECSVGNMGSETVRNYTVMGDAVNLASRLEGINKTYGTHIIISEFTYQDVKNDFLCREVDLVRVKGKLKPVKIYELLAEGKAAQNTTEMAKYFNDGYQKYHEKQFSQAIAQFEKAVGIHPNDATSKLYIQRCQEFLDSPPPEDWDGVFIMKSK